MTTPLEFDHLWDYNDPGATEARFRQLLSQIPAGSANAAELMTQIARTQGLQRHFEEAYVTLDAVERALQPQWVRATIRYFLERGRVYNSSGHADAARSMFLDAWNLASTSPGEDVLAIDAAHMMGIVEPPDKQMSWNLRALAMAESSTIENARRWKASLYNNIGWSYHEQGNFELALDCFQKALIERQARQSLPEIRIAKWCIGRALRSLGKVDEALALQQTLLSELTSEGASDGFVYEEIGECLLLKGQAAEATPYFKLAYTELAQDSWLVAQEPTRLQRLLTLSEEKGN